MADLSLAQETLKHRLEGLSDKIKAHIIMGFHLLSRSDQQNRSNLLQHLLDTTERGDNLDRDRVIEITGLDNHTVSDVLSAIAMVIGMTVDTSISEEDFILFGNNIVFNDEDKDIAREVVSSVISRRSALNDGMKRSDLANSVLPSFQSLIAEVDLRIRFEGDEDTPTGAVAVAVCNLKTDCTDDIWFQIDIKGVKELIKQFEIIAKQLSSAEKIGRDF